MIRLALAIPAYKDAVTVKQAGMWLEIGQALAEYGDQITLSGLITVDTCGVDRARNYLLAHAMKINADWLLMVDSDTWANGRDLLRMIIACAARGAAICGAPVYRRGFTENSLNVYRKTASGLRVCDESDLEALPVIFDAAAIGAAVMAVNLHKIGDEVFKFTDTQSEDLYFCERIRMIGGDILVDKRVSTGHMGKMPMMEYAP